MTEQGTGGVERRHLSTSQPNPENESIQEPKAKARAAPTAEQEEQPKFSQASQDSPRQCNTPAAPSTPSQAPSLSRQASAASTHSAHVVTSQRHPAPTSHSHAERRSPLEPPVTKSTLSELDVGKIIHNPKLRHDINFDPELHFRPNLDGEKGRRKQQKANLFWDALEKQLGDFVNPETRMKFIEECGPGKEWCLPSLLKAVKEIIQTLVPARDRVYLDEGLNVELIMQQFYQGVADLEKLAHWLSRVLKSHCAPMRDEWVDDMYQQLSDGNREGDMQKLVQGMRSLLSVLEAMKLDVANHQIRCLRPVLIEDTVNFEQKFFWKKIQTRRLDISPAGRWYREAEAEFSTSPAALANQQAFGETTIFMNALVKLILPSVSTAHVPNTFLFDEERIIKLRTDLLDTINLEVCMRLYEDLDRLSRFSTIHQANAEADAIAASDFNFNAPPSRPTSGVFSSSGSTCSSSPRNSGCLFPQQTGPSPSDTRSKSIMVYNSLVALLATAPPSSRQSDKWQALAPALALQIFRFTNAPAGMLPTIENKLASQLTDINDSTFKEVEQLYHNKLVTELAKRVKELKGVSGVNLFAIATGGRLAGPGRTWNDGREAGRDRQAMESGLRELRDDTGLEDIAIRLAHLGILHWRVWAPIVYVEGEPGMDFNTTESASVI